MAILEDALASIQLITATSMSSQRTYIWFLTFSLSAAVPTMSFCGGRVTRNKAYQSLELLQLVVETLQRLLYRGRLFLEFLLQERVLRGFSQQLCIL